MATSPDFARYPLQGVRFLTDEVFAALREAVIVVDIQDTHLPVVLANGTARRCVLGRTGRGSSLDATLYSLLGPGAAAAVSSLTGAPSGTARVSRMMTWRLAQGEQTVLTELRMVCDGASHRHAMLSFTEPGLRVQRAEAAPSPTAAIGPTPAVDRPPYDMLVLDTELRVTFANGTAVATAGVTDGSILGLSALILPPTSGLPREAFTAALSGASFYQECLENFSPGVGTRRFEIYLEPLFDGASVMALAVLSRELRPGQRSVVSAGQAARTRLPADKAVDELTAPVAAAARALRIATNRDRARPCADVAGDPSGRSTDLMRLVTAHTADTLLLLDAELRIRFINRALFGVSPADAVGIEFADLLPAAERDLVAPKLRHVLETAAPTTWECVVEREGEKRYYEGCALSISDRGAGCALSLSLRDVTERKRMEQEILRIASRERQSIGRDLHDGLGQELTGVALMLRAFAKESRSPPAAASRLNQIIGYVNQSIETARSLARGLLPFNADNAGLASALRQLAERSRLVYGFAVQLNLDERSGLLNERLASHLYRIAQEALTNTARHARATHISICLVVGKSAFMLRITDDGVGLGAAGEAALGMGLKIMKYRADMVGAKFELLPNDPHGTVILVTGMQSTTPPMARSACST